MNRAAPKIVVLVAGAAATFLLGGCGFGQTSPDLFVLQRSGEGRPLTLLVNDGGTIRCNGGKAKPISDSLLIQARDLADSLDKDAKAKLRVAARPGSVYSYTVRLRDGTVEFADTAAAAHRELARAELFATQVAQGPCSG